MSHEPHTSGATPATSWAPVSSGLGAIEFYSVNYAVQAPQSIVRQLTADDDRTRRDALNALGVPTQYTAKNVAAPKPHSVHMELAPLGTSDEMDALLTVELDHHLVTAVLVPNGSEWHRLATVIFPTAFADASSTPSTFLRTNRSMLDPLKYRAVFRVRENQANGDFQENEAHVRVLNNRAIVTVSFVSGSRRCEVSSKKQRGTCEITRRWLEPDHTAPAGTRRFQMVTAVGHIAGKDSDDPLADARFFQLSRLREFSCQPLVFSDTMLRYDPAGPNGTCPYTGTRTPR
ncbi:MAG: hypothetical protein PW792_03530 [Acidobacteriaceae bacterium]|nr:hypothetical protein [Acidobacteriaceae bacterium]